MSCDTQVPRCLAGAPEQGTAAHAPLHMRCSNLSKIRSNRSTSATAVASRAHGPHAARSSWVSADTEPLLAAGSWLDGAAAGLRVPCWPLRKGRRLEQQRSEHLAGHRNPLGVAKAAECTALTKEGGKQPPAVHGGQTHTKRRPNTEVTHMLEAADSSAA